jgi:hypothetical protein
VLVFVACNHSIAPTLFPHDEVIGSVPVWIVGETRTECTAPGARSDVKSIRDDQFRLLRVPSTSAMMLRYTVPWGTLRKSDLHPISWIERKVQEQTQGNTDGAQQAQAPQTRLSRTVRLWLIIVQGRHLGTIGRLT